MQESIADGRIHEANECMGQVNVTAPRSSKVQGPRSKVDEGMGIVLVNGVISKRSIGRVGWRCGVVAMVAAFAGGCAMVPELGMLVDRGPAQRSIIVRLGEQKAYLYRDGVVVAISPVSPGREGYQTPVGKFRVTQKRIDHRSSLYGAYVKNGKVVRANVSVHRDRKPAGAKFVGAPMPYFLRFSGAYGLHAGNVPGYPASHGCIRLPLRHARRFFHAAKVGTPVFIYR
jgi:hypothetical protein